jgi:heme A synthase
MEIHWAHRMAAFLLLFIAIAAAASAYRTRVSRPVRTAAAVSVALIVLQLGVAAALILARLPQLLQAAHLAVGAAVWFALASWAVLARTPPATRA